MYSSAHLWQETSSNWLALAAQVLDKAQVERAHMAGQIKHEVSIMRRLKHPNVVELKDVMATKSKACTTTQSESAAVWLPLKGRIVLVAGA